MIDENKSKKKILNIIFGIIITIALIFIIVGLVMIKLSSNEKIEDTEEFDSYENGEIDMGNIKVSDYVTSKGNIIVKIENKNNYTIDGAIIIDLYDDNDKKVDIDAEGSAIVAPNSVEYEEIYLSKSGPSYSKYKVNVQFTKSYFENLSNKISIVSDKVVGEKIKAKFKNDTGVKLEFLTTKVIFFDKSGNVIDYDIKVVNDVDVDATSDVEFNKSNQKYDKYKVIVSTALPYSE